MGEEECMAKEAGVGGCPRGEGFKRGGFMGIRERSGG